MADVLHSWERVGDFVAGLHLLVNASKDRINRDISIETGSSDQRRIPRTPCNVKVPLIGGRQLGQNFTILEREESLILNNAIVHWARLQN